MISDRSLAEVRKGYAAAETVLKTERRKMSIMIDMPPAVVEKAEAYAQERGTTLARLFGDYVASLDLRQSGLADRFFGLADEADVHMPAGWKFDRESCYA